MSAATGAVRRRLIWLISIRVVVSTLLLGSAILLQVHIPGMLPADPFFLLIAVTYALTVAYALTIAQAERHVWLVGVQLAGDTLAVSAFVFFTGGILSYFPLLYVLPIIGGGILLGRAGGLLLALLASALFGGLVLGQYVAGWGMEGTLLPAPHIAQYTVAIDASAFFAVAFLSGSLAESLRSADARLQKASVDMADLRAYNQHIINSLTSGLATTDRGGRLLTLNRAAETILGHHAQAVIGRPAREVLQLPADFAALLDADLAGAQVRRADFLYRTGDGATKELGLSATHLVTADGRAGYLLTFQDVTEVRRLERDGRRRQRLAAVGEMAAGIAHEIRNPLASMVGSIQILRQELALSAEQMQLMDIVLRESERLNQTITSFLAYARPQRKARTRVAVGRILEDAALLLRNSPDRREQHTITVEVVPPDLAYEADEHELRQIVWNLATNGLRAMPQGGGLHLAARASESDADGPHHVLIEVADEGVGMSPEELDRMFQPFHGSFAHGTGLGLAIVHRIVSDYNGEIQVESHPGRGTTVRVQLPAPALVTT